jgi:glycosyltransferase involved in cell wall biosynthesis
MYGGVMALIASKTVARVPVVVSFCGSDLLGASLSKSYQRWLASCGVLASRKAARNAAGIVVKSPNLRNALPKDVDVSKVRIIPNGVDLNRFKPLDHAECQRKLDWHPDRFHVLFASNSGDPVKRPALAHAAVNELAARGLPAELHYLSGVPHADVPVWLNGSDVLLVTSITEGSPNVVKEALACDLPVVSVDVGDVGEQIHGVDGCYLAPATAPGLAAKLRLVHTEGRRVRGRAKMEQLSLTQVALRLKAFYTEILSPQRELQARTTYRTSAR